MNIPNPFDLLAWLDQWIIGSIVEPLGWHHEISTGHNPVRLGIYTLMLGCAVLLAYIALFLPMWFAAFTLPVMLMDYQAVRRLEREYPKRTRTGLNPYRPMWRPRMALSFLYLGILIFNEVFFSDGFGFAVSGYFFLGTVVPLYFAACDAVPPGQTQVA